MIQFDLLEKYEELLKTKERLKRKKVLNLSFQEIIGFTISIIFILIAFSLFVFNFSVLADKSFDLSVYILATVLSVMAVPSYFIDTVEFERKNILKSILKKCPIFIFILFVGIFLFHKLFIYIGSIEVFYFIYFASFMIVIALLLPVLLFEFINFSLRIKSKEKELLSIKEYKNIENEIKNFELKIRENVNDLDELITLITVYSKYKKTDKLEKETKAIDFLNNILNDEIKNLGFENEFEYLKDKFSNNKKLKTIKIKHI